MGTRTPNEFTGNLQGVAGNLVTMLDTNLVALGFSILATSGNERIYQPGSGNGYCLYVNDSQASGREATVRIVDAASTIGSLVNPVPSVAQQSDVTCVWRKSSTSNTTNRSYRLVGDDKWFILRVQFNTNAREMYAFGDTERGLSSDAFNTMLAQRSTQDGTGAGRFLLGGSTSGSVNTSGLIRFARSIDGSVVGDLGGFKQFASTFGSQQGQYPNLGTSGLVYTLLPAFSSGSSSLASSGRGAPRGRMPFLFEPWIGFGVSGIAVNDTFTDTSYDASSLFVYDSLQFDAAANSSGNCVIQTAGTWDPSVMR